MLVLGIISYYAWKEQAFSIYLLIQHFVDEYHVEIAMEVIDGLLLFWQLYFYCRQLFENKRKCSLNHIQQKDSIEFFPLRSLM